MSAAAGSEGQRPGFIKAQPAGLGDESNKTSGLKVRVNVPYSRESRNDAGFQPAWVLVPYSQPCGLGFYDAGLWPLMMLAAPLEADSGAEGKQCFGAGVVIDAYLGLEYPDSGV